MGGWMNICVWVLDIWYDVYLLHWGFHPLAVVGSFVQNRKDTAQKEKQYTTRYENHGIRKVKKRKYKTKKNDKNIKKRKSSN
jgi:hypothetical protein